MHLSGGLNSVLRNKIIECHHLSNTLAKLHDTVNVTGKIRNMYEQLARMRNESQGLTNLNTTNCRCIFFLIEILVVVEYCSGP
jgi:hypothetical protein